MYAVRFHFNVRGKLLAIGRQQPSIHYFINQTTRSSLHNKTDSLFVLLWMPSCLVRARYMLRSNGSAQSTVLNLTWHRINLTTSWGRISIVMKTWPAGCTSDGSMLTTWPSSHVNPSEIDGTGAFELISKRIRCVPLKDYRQDRNKEAKEVRQNLIYIVACGMIDATRASKLVFRRLEQDQNT